RLHQTEVEQLDHVMLAAAFTHSDVAGLDVSVDQSDVVRLLQRGAHLTKKIDCALRWKRSVSPYELLEREAFEIFHDVVEDLVLGMAIVKDLNRVRVSERRGQPHLSLEPLQLLRVRCTFRSNELHRTWPAEQEVLRQVNLAHAARAQSLLQHILAELAGIGRLLPRHLDAVRREDDDRGGDAEPEHEVTENGDDDLGRQRT